MTTLKTERLVVKSQNDVVLVRQKTRVWSAEIGMSLVDQTKIVTAASELARNTVVHGGGGEVVVEVLEDGGRRGVRLTFEDKGPGISNLDLAMRDGYTTGNGLGMGLSGSKRLVNDFDIKSEVGAGTTVTVVRWK